MNSKKIIQHFKKSNSYEKIWEVYKHGGYSRKQIKNILLRAGFKIDPEIDEMFEVDNSREFRYLTDKDLNFEKEIKTKLF